MEQVRRILQSIWSAYSGDAAWQAVADISRFHRIQASPGHRGAAELVRQRLTEAGLQAEILYYPADDVARFWTWESFQEWTCSEATLHLVEPVKEARLLADYRGVPVSVIQRSAPFEGKAEVVLLEDGVKEADYESIEVEGKVVLSRGDLRQVWELAVKKHGAIGILYDGMRTVPPVRPEGDLADSRQYTSFWWQPGDPKCFGFVLTPRQGAALRRLLKAGENPVVVRAKVDCQQYDGSFEVVTASIPGETGQEIVVVSHLCHPMPSANDNASGAAAALEAARTLSALVSQGDLAPPKRTIRFLWLPEMTGSVAYLSSGKAAEGGLVAGINLDMVGEAQNQTGSVWLLERPPDAAASFAPELLALVRDLMPDLPTMTDVAASHTSAGRYPLYRQAETPFSGGSDHYIFSDPSVGIPMPMLIQWPDRFYHTSADTPDRTDPQSLARSGTLAAAYAYWLATAATEEATWLGYAMVARFKAGLVQAAQKSVSEALALEDGPALSEAASNLDRRLAYLKDRQQAAVNSLERLAPVDCLIPELSAELEYATQRELAWATQAIRLRAAALGLDALPEPDPQDETDEDREAMALVPHRLTPGPIPFGSYLSRLDEQERSAWRGLLEARSEQITHSLPVLALYWADGQRTILDIADLVELEVGKRDVELLLTYFRLLEKLGLVELEGPR